MPDTTSVPFSDAAHTSRLMSAATVAFGELMQAVIADLPPGQQLLLTNVLEDGGRIGIELTVDKAGKRTMQVVGLEPEGTRRPVATVIM